MHEYAMKIKHAQNSFHHAVSSSCGLKYDAAILCRSIDWTPTRIDADKNFWNVRKGLRQCLPLPVN